MLREEEDASHDSPPGPPPGADHGDVTAGSPYPRLMSARRYYLRSATAVYIRDGPSDPPRHLKGEKDGPYHSSYFEEDSSDGSAARLRLPVRSQSINLPPSGPVEWGGLYCIEVRESALSPFRLARPSSFARLPGGSSPHTGGAAESAGSSGGGSGAGSRRAAFLQPSPPESPGPLSPEDGWRVRRACHLRSRAALASS